MLHPHEYQSQIMGQNGWDLMFSLVSSKFLAMRNISLYSVTGHVTSLFSGAVLEAWQTIILNIY